MSQLDRSVTVQRLLNRFVSEGGTYRSGLGTKTIEQYDHSVRSLEIWSHDHLIDLRTNGIEVSSPLRSCELRPQLVNAHLRWYLDTPKANGEPRSAVSVMSRKRMISTLWRFAYELEESPPWVDGPPRKLLRLSEPAAEPIALTKEETLRVIDEAWRLKGYFPNTGIRRSLFMVSLTRAGWECSCRCGDLIWHPTEQPWGLKLTEIGEDGRLNRTQHKTGDKVLSSISQTTIDILYDSLPPYRDEYDLAAWPWLNGMRHFRTKFGELMHRAGVEGTFKALRKGSGTDVYRQKGIDAARSQLGHRPDSRATAAYLGIENRPIAAPNSLDE